MECLIGTCLSHPPQWSAEAGHREELIMGFAPCSLSKGLATGTHRMRIRPERTEGHDVQITKLLIKERQLGIGVRSPEVPKAG